MQEPVKYLVIIDGGEGAVALLFTAARVQVAEFDASSEEVAAMTDSLLAGHSASAPEWDTVLSGFSPAARVEASVYTLAV
jgi:hypothetical protein